MCLVGGVVVQQGSGESRQIKLVVLQVLNKEIQTVALPYGQVPPLSSNLQCECLDIRSQVMSRIRHPTNDRK